MKVVAIVIMCLALTSCATLRNIGTTVNDAASLLCNVFAEEHIAELDGLSPADWCAIKGHLDPFIDYVLDVQSMPLKEQ